MEIELKTGILHLENNEKLLSLTDFSSRLNKKRGFLFVSKVLGKHIPCNPSEMEKTYLDLANKLRPKLNGKPTIVIGFAETATGIGNGVFEKLALENSFYIHSTRYHLDKKILVAFLEEHSHAASHRLYYPEEGKLLELLENAENIVLVDDEITTGKTIINIINQLKLKLPKVKNYFAVSILNWGKDFQEELDYTYIYKGTFEFKLKEFTYSENIKSETADKRTLDKIIPYNFGRIGIQNLNFNFENYINPENFKGKKVLVLGSGEFMYQPYKLAKFLEMKGIDVYYQSTTRSPINIDGAIKSRLHFLDNYHEDIDNFVYNVSDKKYNSILLCYETTVVPEKHDLKAQLKEYFSEVEEIFFKS